MVKSGESKFNALKNTYFDRNFTFKIKIDVAIGSSAKFLKK